MQPAMRLRTIARDDIEELAALVAEAWAGYRSFAPKGWRPPKAEAQSAALSRWIEDPDFWGELASREGELAGHATFIPAARHTLVANEDPGLAHLGHMFVRPEHWGTGVAARLMERALEAATKRGYWSMRLFVPEGQARARRFYAREGFGQVGEPLDMGVGLSVLEYRRPLEGGDTRTRA